MSIQHISSRSNTLARGSFQPAQAQAPGLSRNDSTGSKGSGRGYSSADVFETAPGKKDPGPGAAIRNSLAHAGVDPSTSREVMDAVRSGTPLATALQNAGVTPEQHQSVMASVQAQDPANAGGVSSGPETAIRNSLAHAGVDPSTGREVMDAVRSGTSLAVALQNAGVTPEQHQSVMASVQAQDPANAGGVSSGISES